MAQPSGPLWVSEGPERGDDGQAQMIEWQAVRLLYTNASCTDAQLRPTCCAACPGHRIQITFHVDFINNISLSLTLSQATKQVGVC